MVFFLHSLAQKTLQKDFKVFNTSALGLYGQASLGLKHLVNESIEADLRPYKLLDPKELGIGREVERKGFSAENICATLNRGYQAQWDKFDKDLQKHKDRI